MYIRILFVFCFLLSLPSTVMPAGSESVRMAMYRYNTDNSYIDSEVTCFGQDRHGFIWFGTVSGLARFDGVNYKLFNIADKPSANPPKDVIYSIYIAPDDKIWLGTQLGVKVYDPRNNTMARFDSRTQYGVIISTEVNSITGDDQGRIWFGTQGQGLFIYNKRDDTLMQNSNHASQVNVITKASNGNFYIGSEMGTVSEFSADGAFQRVLYRSGYTGNTREINVSAILPCRDTVWIAISTGGLLAICPWDGRVLMGQQSQKKQNIPEISKILQSDGQKLMLGTANGLQYYDIRRSEFIRIWNQDGDAGSGNHAINDIFRDAEGGVWVATKYVGVDYIPRPLKTFWHFRSDAAGALNAGRVVSCFCEDGSGNVWVGTHDAGVAFLEKQNASDHERYRIRNVILPDQNIQCILYTGKELWMGTASSGLFVLDVGNGRIRNYRHDHDARNTINDNNIQSLFRDSRGNIYIGTPWGLNVRHPDQEVFMPVPAVGNRARICSAIQDRSGNIWFASANQGMFQYDPFRNEWRYHLHNPEFPNSIASNTVQSVLEDFDGRIWVGTDEGLCCYRHEENGFITFDRMLPPGLAVHSMEQDRPERLWISTNAGLFYLNTATGDILNHFTRTDGLQSNQFNIGASLRCGDGTLLFGGNNGFNYFDPWSFSANKFIPSVVITGIEVDERQYTDLSIYPRKPKGERIKIRGMRMSLTLCFTSLSFQSPTKNHYRYKLAGFDEKWIDTEGVCHASYGKLPAGNYTFHVSGSNNDGVWNPDGASLEIAILPPWYKSRMAFVFYVLLLLALIYGCIRETNRLHRHKLRQYKQEQERKSDRSKIDFFTHVAHEIRTPLSLIKVPLEHLITNVEGTDETKKFLRIIEKNTNSLLGLINQLLDFRKSERDDYRPVFTPQDIVKLTSEVYDNFINTLKINNIESCIILPDQEMIFNVERDGYVKIVNNLLSNASKYAATLIEIRLEMHDHSFSLHVSDDGPGIEPQEMERVFETFYQAGNNRGGTGMGLPLAKSLAEKHNGTITVSCSPLGGVEFVVTIPLLEATAMDGADGSENSKTEISTVDKGTCYPESETSPPAILLVEDDVQLRELLADILSHDYRILPASTGRQALETLETQDADIIVSDVMMPEMDGYELCGILKSDIRYCHIPVIQLTARTSLEDKRKGLQTGADSYMEKPFSIELLKDQIDNLLENRRRLRHAYSDVWLTKGSVVQSQTERDREFIEKLNNNILERMRDEKFYIEDLAESMFMSRSNFYRKIKGLFGVSPNDYLKKCRLRYAVTLIKGGESRINDLCMLVGFNSPSYFSKCFREEYGCTPKEYIDRRPQ